jgi:hypothetical protein
MTAPKSEVRVIREAIHESRCSDGNCLFSMPEMPKGMVTNGGCRCLKEIKYSDLRMKVQRLSQAYKQTSDQEVQALKAEIDRLNNKYDFQLLVKSNEALKEEIASMNDSNFKLYNQTEEQFKIIQDQKNEIEVLKAKLKYAREEFEQMSWTYQSRDKYKDLAPIEEEHDKDMSSYDFHIAQITIDSIKRGE